EVCRRSLQDETARLIREAQGEAARRLAEEPSAESRLGASGGRTPEWVEGLAGQVADRILRTIFDRPGK
ncbi:MAG: hypothetical protein LBQ61_09640, partial [Spirochaetales bacterium]|nr:hypothetical protein [Spirochaetales bacterium]